MSQSENIFDPARLVLDLPICPRCGARMWLSRIEPYEPGRDKRTFECPQCNNLVSQTLKTVRAGR
jgi:transposase-like protein